MNSSNNEDREPGAEHVFIRSERTYSSDSHEVSDAGEHRHLQNTHEEIINLRHEMRRLKQEQEAWVWGRQGFEDRAKTTIQVVNSPDPPIASISIGELLATLMDARSVIFKMLLFFLFIGAAYILIAEPVYRVDALLETGSRSDMMGDISKGISENSTYGEGAVNEAIEILQSRKVLGKVVDNFHLDVIAEPVRFPLIGTAIARINTRIRSLAGPQFEPDMPLFDLNKFAWSNEQMEIEAFDIPAELFGSVFTLSVIDDGQYQLFDEDGHLLTQGSVGVPNKDWLPNGAESNLLVSKLIKTTPGNRFELTRISRVDAINRLREYLVIAEKALGSGVVQITLEGPDRHEIAAIVNKMLNTFVKIDKDNKAEKIQQSLDFMESQIPMLKKQEEMAANALKEYRSRYGAVDLSRETQVLMERMVALATELSEARSKRNEMLYKYTPQNPKVKAIDAQVSDLNRELKTIEKKVHTFPDTEQRVLSLTKDAELYSQLYATLRNQVGQLKLVREAPDGYVGVVDFAVPTIEPVSPQKPIVLALALVLGAFSGMGTAFLRKSLRGAIQDPEDIEKKLGLPVYATIPHSIEQHKLWKTPEDTKEAVLAIAKSTDPAIESVRSLRTSLHFVLNEAKNNVILVTGPTPGIGKSFLTVNLGTVLANIGKRVLIIDADLRKGRLNKNFGKGSNEGLSDIIVSGNPIEQVIKKTYVDRLDIICTGPVPPNPSELLADEYFVNAVEKLSLQYDYILIDSPPVLVVADPAIIGRLAGTAMLVVKAGVTTSREIEQSIKRLERGGISLRGVVFNDMPISKNRYGYGDYYGYAYTYAYKK